VGRNKHSALRRSGTTVAGRRRDRPAVEVAIPPCRQPLRTPVVAALPDYRRALMPRGRWFFTANLLDRRCRVLTDNIDALRVATRLTQTRRPFTNDAIGVLLDRIHAV
jgi:hypothetical protein